HEQLSNWEQTNLLLEPIVSRRFWKFEPEGSGDAHSSKWHFQMKGAAKKTCAAIESDRAWPCFHIWSIHLQALPSTCSSIGHSGCDQLLANSERTGFWRNIQLLNPAQTPSHIESEAFVQRQQAERSTCGIIKSQKSSILLTRKQLL